MIKVEVYRGDITQLELDALVNAANNRLWMGSGVGFNHRCRENKAGNQK